MICGSAFRFGMTQPDNGHSVSDSPRPITPKAGPSSLLHCAPCERGRILSMM
jgi:hypothetical protein